MTGNRKTRDSLSPSDLDLEDLGMRLELAITRAVQPEASVPGVPDAGSAGHLAALAEPTRDDPQLSSR